MQASIWRNGTSQMRPCDWHFGLGVLARRVCGCCTMTLRLQQGVRMTTVQ